MVCLFLFMLQMCFVRPLTAPCSVFVFCSEFDKLTRLVERQTNVSERVPSLYIRTLTNLESSLNTALAKEKDAKKKMNAPNARALNTMKQKVKKTAKDYEKEIQQLQEVRTYAHRNHLCRPY